MFRPLLLLFTFIITGGWLNAQDSLNRTDSKGLRQGAWIKLDKEGRKVYEGQFVDGIPCGVFRYYYPDGKLKTVASLSENGRVSRTITYSANGRKIAEGKYVDEKKDSTWKYFSEIDGVLLSEEKYKKGRLEGKAVTFYAAGGIAEEISYTSGTKDGPWVQYFEDGKVKLKGIFIKGLKEGRFSVYYGSGQIMMSGSYRNGLKEGAWNYYDDKGKLQKTETYSGGIKLEP